MLFNDLTLQRKRIILNHKVKGGGHLVCDD
jgi:hypothetical protein